MPEPEEEDLGGYIAVAAAEKPKLADDGLLHPRARDVVFSGAPRGPVTPLAERLRFNPASALSLRGMQVLGAAAFTLMCWFIALRAIGDNGTLVGLFAGLGVLVPLGTLVAIQTQIRNEFWWQWCGSRGFEPGAGDGPGKIVPSNLNRSPLMGTLDDRVIELAARRTLGDRREAIVGGLLRVAPPAEELDPRSAPTGLWRTSFVIMSIPPVSAARWPGASIRADHYARRPLVLRSMIGALVAGAVPDGRSHLAAAPTQDPRQIQHLVDARLEQYLVGRPMDVDIVDDLLVVMRDGAPAESEALEELCRDALLLHELLVPEHELPIVAAPVEPQAPVAEEPVIDLTREGWGETVEEFHAEDYNAGGEYAEAA